LKNIYSLLTPIALTLVFIELVYIKMTKKNFVTFQDSIGSFSTAIGNQLVNIAVAAAMLKGYGYLHDNYALLKIEVNIPNFLILLLSIDFIFYWFHRAGHSINIFWAAHSPHHSAEEMNLIVALRASITQRLFSFSFFWPLALIGFQPGFIYGVVGIHLILGYWHHTRTIGKLGWFEKYFNTPSHHRVHHGTNEQYLDKNYAEVLIVWDKLFGTFAEEREEVSYGILRHPESWNPITINFHFWGLLWRDCLETKSWKDKVRLWFMPLGWRPADVSYREPVKSYKVGERTKFQTTMLPNSKIYLVLQLVLNTLLMVFVMSVKCPLLWQEKLVMSTLIWAGLIGISAVMESKKWTLPFELTRIFFCFIFLTTMIKKYNFSDNLIYIIGFVEIGFMLFIIKNFKEKVQVNSRAL
jgi:alkylglycerol monooxygenase